ncbi:hypothetical protein KSC_021580 [Ktedonobacter sp. SOSP1-52]|uniref:hypothetical protein n=1 Tax=Ktedonobacter sp. SOSP1-52 TaxID=2778366 RepID=UPI001915759B|nr:hypothetical protein [Ktedonobacter sp. SOSP1-52]GHO63266.1 hypothetical protein KSC_021580 [Ktedonobacter sp. SOSP1-52]
MSTAKTEQVTTSAPELKEPKRERSSLGSVLARSASSGVVTALAIAIGLLWSVPTFGLFVSSFRPPSLINTTGWWTGLVPPGSLPSRIIWM